MCICSFSVIVHVHYTIMQDVSDYEFAHDFPVCMNLLGFSLCVRCYC